MKQLLTILVLALVINNGVALSGETARWSAPVVLTGEQVSKLKGIAPKTLVAFRYTTQWEQVPVQVDERAVVDFLQIYGPAAQTATYKPRSFKTLIYIDVNTLTGADPDATLDNDDEIVFMLRDSGAKAPAAAADPAGVVAGSGVEVVVGDAVTGASTYAYLYSSSGTLQSSAGKKYVTYSFNLTSGDYKTTYKYAAGPNPETTTITTPYYIQGFSDRWITDSLALLPPQGTGVDILDQQKFEFAPGYAGRTVKTFCAGEGAFIANINGAVRAIRSFIGANSGPSTQRTYIFYEGREDIITHLRVHEIPGGVSFFDYSSAAKGMRYSNNNNPSGVIVDGVGDTIAAGALSWEMLTGTQGTLCIAEQVKTDIPSFTSSSYYLDAVSPTIPQPTGDTSAYGASGLWMNKTIPNTDPASSSYYQLSVIQCLTFESLSSPSTQAARRSREQLSPLTLTAFNRTGGIVANKAPVITSYSPASVISLIIGATQAFQVIAIDDDGDALSYVWTVNGQTVPGSTNTLSWNASSEGTKTIAVKVSDGKGGSDSRTWTVTVSSANRFPIVKIASPADGATYTAPATISGTIQASDSDGTIVKVEIFVGTKLMSTLTKSPYTITYSNVAAGTYYVTATATDNLGAATSSAPVRITVNSAVAAASAVMALESAPAAETQKAGESQTARIQNLKQNQAPVLDSELTATPAAALIGATVAFAASASDPDGDPLTYSWDFGDGVNATGASVLHAFAAVGDYAVVLIVSDGSGASATSSVTVAVTAPGVEENGVVSEELTINAMGIALVFVQGGKDSIALSGKIILPDGFTAAGKSVTLDIGGVSREFTLNAKGKASSSTEKFVLKINAKNGSAKITAKSSKGTFSSALEDEGFTSAEATRVEKTVHVSLTIDTLQFSKDQTMIYTSKSGKGKSYSAGQ